MSVYRLQVTNNLVRSIKCYYVSILELIVGNSNCY